MQRPTSGSGHGDPRSPEGERPLEQELLARVRNGQSDAFGAIVRQYQDRIFNTCWRICGNLEDARDLTQEAFLKAYERLDTFKGQSTFYTWLFRIAVNMAISFQRSGARRRVVSLDHIRERTQASRLVSRSSVTDDTTRSGTSNLEMQGLVVEAIQSLNHDYRAVLVLRDIEGLDYREIGEILEIPYGTVKSRLHRARQAIRIAIEPGVPPATQS